LPRPLPEPGFLKKIDLAAEPPKMACQGDKREPDLRARIVAASEPAGALFVLEDRRNPQFTHEPSRRVKVFNASDLKFQRTIELPLTDCHCLQVSRDGKYLYALDAEEAKLAVVDIALGRQVKVLENVGTYPYFLRALP
jgi:hypothetical protein